MSISKSTFCNADETKAAECLRRLGQEQIDLQQQLGVFPNNVVGTGSQPEGKVICGRVYSGLSRRMQL